MWTLDLCVLVLPKLKGFISTQHHTRYGKCFQSFFLKIYVFPLDAESNRTFFIFTIPSKLRTKSDWRFVESKNLILFRKRTRSITQSKILLTDIESFCTLSRGQQTLPIVCNQSILLFLFPI